MAKVSLNTIKNWFKTNLKPTQAQFWDTWDSFWHKDEMIPFTQIEKLDDLLDAKADKDEIRSHLTDVSAHQDLFDNKVDKVAGKGLSSNDFTDTLKEYLEKLPTKEYVDAKYLITNQNTTYNYNLHNRRTLIIQNDVTLTMPQAMQDGFECTILVDGNFTVTNAVEAGLTMSPLATSALGENKMQYVVKVANRILIYGENE